MRDIHDTEKELEERAKPVLDMCISLVHKQDSVTWIKLKHQLNLMLLQAQSDAALRQAKQGAKKEI